MAKDIYVEEIDLGTNPTHRVYAGRENVHGLCADRDCSRGWPGALTQFGLFYSYVHQQGAARLGTIWKDTSMKQSEEWVVRGEDEPRSAITFHPTLGNAITALAKRTLPAALEEDQQPEPEQPDVKVLLANRILVHSKACDTIREGLKKAYTVEEIQTAADGLKEALAVIRELERLWETLYGEVPSILDVHKAALDD